MTKDLRVPENWFYSGYSLIKIFWNKEIVNTYIYNIFNINTYNIYGNALIVLSNMNKNNTNMV